MTFWGIIRAVYFILCHLAIGIALGGFVWMGTCIVLIKLAGSDEYYLLMSIIGMVLGSAVTLKYLNWVRKELKNTLKEYP